MIASGVPEEPSYRIQLNFVKERTWELIDSDGATFPFFYYILIILSYSNKSLESLKVVILSKHPRIFNDQITVSSL
jgi:hypothetical protein